MFQPVEPIMCEERGVTYFRIRWPNLEFVPRGFVRYQVTTIHVPTGRRYEGHIYLDQFMARRKDAFGMNDLERLVHHWSASMPKMWKYEIPQLTPA